MFALPGMFCFFAVVIIPFVYGIYLTLTDWNGVAEIKNFVGFKNFQGVVKDEQFWTSLLLTFKYVILVVVLVNVIAFLLAYLLTRGIKGQNFFRAGFFTPNLIGGIVLGYICIFQSVCQYRGVHKLGTVRGIVAVRSYEGVYCSCGSVRVAALRLYDTHICGRFYGTERGCDGGGQYRRRNRLEEDEEYRDAAYDVVYNHLPVSDIVPGVYGI